MFADRPYAEMLAPARVPYVLAYIHNNPVRARLVGWAGDIAWSSHRSYLGLEATRAGLSVPRGLELCGYSDDGHGRASFDEWVRSCAGEVQAPRRALAREALRAARERTGAPAELETPLHTCQGLTFPIVLRAASTWGPARLELTPQALIAKLSKMLGVDARGRSARDHRPAVAQARRVALSVWERAGGPRVQMARALGIGASAASELVH